MVEIKITEMGIGEFNQLSRLVYAQSGIHLEEHKLELLQARLRKRLRILSLGSFKEYYRHVVSDESGEELRHMLDHVSTHKTEFFRENKHFILLSQRLLPELVAETARRMDKTLRIWCAACSSGEEAYSLAMCALESAAGAGVKVKILATDLSNRVIQSGQEGLYGLEKVQPIPPALLQKYFISRKRDGEKFYEVGEGLRQAVHFRRFNLNGGDFSFRNTFDVIFCRNVTIYFDRETQEDLVKRLSGALRKEGYLFTGLSESLLAIRHKLISVASSVYRKP